MTTLYLREPARKRAAPRTYDRAAFHASIRPTDMFLCTYPKSGTTWLGFLIAHAIRASESESLDLKSFNQYVPDVNLLYTKRGSLDAYTSKVDPRFFLCHATYDEQLPKVVYVVRDPRDTMLSYRHYQKFLKADYDVSLEDFCADDKHWPCDWDVHVASWLMPRRHKNLVVVRYEDLHLDAESALRAVFDLAELNVSTQRIKAAVEASRFDRMRDAEEKFGVHGKDARSGERFVRKGQVGSWRDEMSSEAIANLEEKYGDVMRLLGYETVS